MQPQGHVQVLLNTEVFIMNPQEALDAPRFCIAATQAPQVGLVYIEDRIDQDVVQSLKDKSHKVEVLKEWKRVWFVRGQLIGQRYNKGTWKLISSASSDGRGDGFAIPA